MNRVIKFRGQRSDSKSNEFVYGFYTHTNLNFHPCIHISVIEVYPVFPETVGQYTGLKDKNGVEIYEGDIIKKNRLVPLIGVVVYKTESARFWISIPRVGQKDDWTFIGDNCEVIGNIYSNQELLK